MHSNIIASTVSCSVSITASLILIVWEIFQYRRLITTEVERPIALQLSNCIIMLCIADIIANISNLLSFLNYLPGFCYVQAQVTEFGALSTILWTAGISIYHFYQIRSCSLGKDIRKVAAGSNKLFLSLFLLCWGIPFLVELAALNTNVFATTSPGPYVWCLFQPNLKYAWIYMLYVWVVSVFILNIIMWAACYHYMKQMAPKASQPTLRLLAGYSVAFLLSWFMPLLRRSWGAWGPADLQALDILQFGMDISVPLQGFFNLIVYGFFRRTSVSHKNVGDESVPFIGSL